MEAAEKITKDVLISSEPVRTEAFDDFLAKLKSTSTWNDTKTGSGEDIPWHETLAKRAFDRGGKFFVKTYKDENGKEWKVFEREIDIACCDAYMEGDDTKVLKAVGKTDNSSIATPYNHDKGEDPQTKLEERIEKETGLSKGQYMIELVHDNETDYQNSKDMPLPTKFNITRYKVVINKNNIKDEYVSTGKHPVTLRWE
jgi:hypothetical protein